MRYRELEIGTQRQTPARARNEGQSILRRAGYLSSTGEATALGRRTLERIEALAHAEPASELFRALRLPIRTTEDGASYFVTDSGREDLLTCPACGYSARQDTARFRKVLPKPEALVPLERVETPACNTIEELARFLGVPKHKTAKALMYVRSSDGRFIFVVIRGDMQLSESKLRRCVGAVRLASTEEIVAAGATPGYASPIGLRDGLIVVDDAIPGSANLVAGANEQGYHLRNTNHGRDYRSDLTVDLALAVPGSGCPNCGSEMCAAQGELMLDGNDAHTGAILEALAEVHHDEMGLVLPPSVAPFDVYLVCLNAKGADTCKQAAKLHDDWERSNISVLFDDRDERAGVKFADADLIGCPVRMTVGERSMKTGMVELKARSNTELQSIPYADAIAAIQAIIKTSP